MIRNSGERSLTRLGGAEQSPTSSPAPAGDPGSIPAVGANWDGLADRSAQAHNLLVAVPGPSTAPATPLPDEPTRRAQVRRLIAAANELLDLAAQLERADGPGPAVLAPAATERASEDDGRWLRSARQAYRLRRARTQFLNDALFGEPAWDLLLDLFIAAKERKRVPVTSACIGAAVPTTTALRWLTILEEQGLILREADPTDARRIFVQLTAEGYAKMVAYFARTAVAEGDDAHDGVRTRA